MLTFKEFLSDTSGIHLINFWLDCEYFADTVEEYNEAENAAVRNQLFRDIQDKYRMKLTQDAQKQINDASRNANLSHTVFIRTQYDVLRRLRVYWLPRFLIHKERKELRGLAYFYSFSFLFYRFFSLFSNNLVNV